MSSRRDFLRRLGAGLGGGAALGSALASQLARAATGARAGGPSTAAARPATPRSLAAIDAGALEVLPGKSLPVRIPGVRIEYIRLRMPDGVHLAATLYLPQEVSAVNRVPTILEVLPYRKDDDYLSRDLDRHGFYARHGYAGLRLDVRGTGASIGLPKDEYSIEEHDDTLHVIDWLSKQPWSNGSVGMAGISYGAFNSVQAAAMNPPALKAIAACAGTDDRYTDDVHYFNGALHLFENTWAVDMVASIAMPGGPDYDPRSQASIDRFNTPPWMMRWIHEQVDSPYWRRGSLRPDYGRLKIPIFLMAGWLDGYHNFVPRIMKSSPAISKGMVGPWPHSYPDDPQPGPQIDFRNQILLRWWDEFLKEKKTGVLDEPVLSAYLMDWYEPALRLKDLEEIPGEWLHLASWPATAFEPSERFFLKPESDGGRAAGSAGRGGSLAEISGRAAALDLRYRPWVGSSSKTWAPNGDGSYGLDQRRDDAYGLAFDSGRLRDPVAILGFARARLWVSATAPVANWIVRLCDVAPDGTSHYVSKGVLNGTHRRSHTEPEALSPGEIYELEIELHCTGWRFGAGHRIRLVVNNADWPVLWPSPHPMTTTLYCGGDRPSHVDLPVFGGASLQGPELHKPPKMEYAVDLESNERPLVWEVTRDEANGSTRFRFEHGWDLLRHPAGITATQGQVMVARVDDAAPARASLEVESHLEVRSGSRSVASRGAGALRSDAGSLYFDVTCTILENGRPLRTRRWQDQAPRRLL